MKATKPHPTIDAAGAAAAATDLYQSACSVMRNRDNESSWHNLKTAAARWNAASQAANNDRIAETQEKTQDAQPGLLHPVVIPTDEFKCDWCNYEAALAICCMTEPKLTWNYSGPHALRCQECGNEMTGDDHEELGRRWDAKKRQPEYAI